MIEGLQPYAEYKESGLPWLDRIPSRWDESRSKYLFREVDVRSATGDEMRLSMSQRHGLIPSASVEEKRLVSKTNVGGKICEPGDLVLNRLKAHLGVFALASLRGIVSPDYSVFRALGSINGRYFCTLYRSPYCGQELRRTAKGIVEGFWRLYTNDFYDIRVPVPPPDEQAAIVRFLDHANRKMDGFIRAKRKLIALLGEQKQAIIHRVVTRGLDPNAPLKPSGIPWLGDIPTHWEVLALKRVLRRLIDCEHKTAPATDGSELRVVRTTGIRHGQLRFHGTYGTTPEAFKQWTRRGLPEAGDVLFTREAPAGEACVMPEGTTLCMGQRTVLMKLRANRINAHFLVHSIYGGPPRTAITLASQGSTVGHFNMSDIGDLTVFLPPLGEQIVIVEAIERDIEPLNTAIARTEREIVLMQEYRTRLTADVVTGKLDVRPAAAKLPALPDEAAAEPLADEAEEELEPEEAEA